MSLILVYTVMLSKSLIKWLWETTAALAWLRGFVLWGGKAQSQLLVPGQIVGFEASQGRFFATHSLIFNILSFGSVKVALYLRNGNP